VSSLKITPRSQKPKFGQLILRNIIEFLATKCQILRLKCANIDFRWGSASTPLGKLTALPDPLAGKRGPTSEGRGREGVQERERWGRRGEVKGGEGRGGEGSPRMYL